VIDEAGPWGTGPFTLVQGASSITTRNVIMSADPYACTWQIEGEQRDPLVVLEANLDHWNRAERGPRVQRAVFRNDLTPDRALQLCVTTDGEVDIVTEVSPADAGGCSTATTPSWSSPMPTASLSGSSTDRCVTSRWTTSTSDARSTWLSTGPGSWRRGSQGMPPRCRRSHRHGAAASRPAHTPTLTTPSARRTCSVAGRRDDRSASPRRSRSPGSPDLSPRTSRRASGSRPR